MTIKVAIVISHPIQHFCPQYSSYSKIPSIELKVFFASKIGLKPYKDRLFDQEVSWGNLYLDEFDHDFVNGEAELAINSQLDSKNLEAKLQQFSPDFIIINGYFQKFQRRAFYWATKNKIKIFYISDSELSQKRFPGLSYLKKIYLNSYFRKISAFFTVGDSNEDYYKHFGVPRTKMFRTFFPIDIVSFDSAFSNWKSISANFLNQYQISNEDFIITTVGKIVSFKSQIDVILALLKLESFTKRRIVYFVIGSGPDKPKLEEIIQQLKFHKVIFTGFTKPEELPPYYFSTSLYIHPSKVEPHSLAVSEAIYSGCPILISDRCGSYGPTDDVQQGYNGFVYEYGNSEQLSNYIRLFIGNPDLLKEFSANSKELAHQHQNLAHGLGLVKAIQAICHKV